jgi:hypothetical protein
MKRGVALTRVYRKACGVPPFDGPEVPDSSLTANFLLSIAPFLNKRAKYA